jgi:protoporphyrinogen oxidase
MGSKKTIIIGGGPAGIAAAYELSRRGRPALLLEQFNQLGGIARTEKQQGYYFDLGGHRFFTKNKEINQLWRQLLGGDFLTRRRLSRIYYQRKYFNYPLKPWNALNGLGLLATIKILLSYLKQKVWPIVNEISFADWVTNRFGRRLYEIFFKSYTEKVWGISCAEISAEWAAQRIKGMSLTSAVLNAIGIGRKNKIKTLIDQFNYPRYGPGMMWEAMAKCIGSWGGEIRLNSQVTALEFTDSRLDGLIVNDSERIAVEECISSLPLKELFMHANCNSSLTNQAGSLRYRSLIIVVLLIGEEHIFPDNWLYIHSPEVRLGRVQNFKNWSPDMVFDQAKTCLGLEYFCDAGDEFWHRQDQDLIDLGGNELWQIGLLKTTTKVIQGWVVRVKDAYPVYDANYQMVIGPLRAYLATIRNFQTIGRAGMHRYNNMDHAMLTGLYAARNVINGNRQYDLWSINADQEYHEEEV